MRYFKKIHMPAKQKNFHYFQINHITVNQYKILHQEQLLRVNFHMTSKAYIKFVNKGFAMDINALFIFT